MWIPCAKCAVSQMGNDPRQRAGDCPVQNCALDGSDPGQTAGECPMLCSVTEVEMAQGKGAGELIALFTETGSDSEYFSVLEGV